ncbi:thiamine kinase-like enzyme [Cytobacillus purgationiresistens]|uniref:Thiamine kinase-like enzyme n=1 Tax=Cytobacillus purgationiresistens TaxID=863449 RepID=A0ABU0ABC6_9BACI|nr:thiamine kinase-like enzyme [Cytobacillus purgationiresistens]
MKTYEDKLMDSIDYLINLGRQLKKEQFIFSLVHTDLHHWNIMRENNQMMIIDWEGLKLAPPEADLMFIMKQPYKKEFINVYSKQYPSHTLNNDALRFYEIKRNLEDIWEFIVQIQEDPLISNERRKAFSYLQKEINHLGRLLKKER